MPNPNAIVDTVSQLDPSSNLFRADAGKAASGEVTVRFSSGQSARLSHADARSTVYAEILEDMQRVGAPVYVEVDPADNNRIELLLLPLTVAVKSLNPNEYGDVEVELEISHGRHVLRASHTDFGELLETLRKALARGTQVIVTETDIQHEIIDVRETSIPFVLERPRPAGAKFDITILRSVTPQRATQLFNILNGISCEPRTPSTTCIPFLYPDDGCWGRAHEMCRRIIGVGEQPGKVWAYGRLRVSTRNHPDCAKDWDWHVAPTLTVSSGGSTRRHVIDPSLFTEHVTEEEWLAALGTINSTAHTDASIFYRSKEGGVSNDPLNSRTDLVLLTHRNLLKNRSVGSFGPPPYNHCL